MSPERYRVAIVGGGCAGLQAALHLRSEEIEVTLIDRRNFHFFQPLATRSPPARSALGRSATRCERTSGGRPAYVIMAEVIDLHFSWRPSAAPGRWRCYRRGSA